jgi:alkylated DNA repair dioxygenase AlkB
MFLEPGSLTVMKDDARYAWKHAIPARKTDTYQGHKVERQRRLSLTFRTVLKPE